MVSHSNFNTTADVYSHLDYSSKYESANALSKALSFNRTEEKQSEEEIDDDIEKLEKLLEEKKKLKQKKKDFEM